MILPFQKKDCVNCSIDLLSSLFRRKKDLFNYLKNSILHRRLSHVYETVSPRSRQGTRDFSIYIDDKSYKPPQL